MFVLQINKSAFFYIFVMCFKSFWSYSCWHLCYVQLTSVARLVENLLFYLFTCSVSTSLWCIKLNVLRQSSELSQLCFCSTRFTLSRCSRSPSIIAGTCALHCRTMSISEAGFTCSLKFCSSSEFRSRGEAKMLHQVIFLWWTSRGFR